MREFFPNNRVEYFVSYYDYYQPEAYIPSSDTYIEKDSSINDEIDRLRHSTTAALLTRRDVIVVASVSCIYGMGNPEEYRGNLLDLNVGIDYDMRNILRRLVDMQYDRNDMTLGRGNFRVRGDTIEVHPAYEESVLRIEMFGDTIDRITTIDPLTGEQLSEMQRAHVFPATHYVTGNERMAVAMGKIEAELQVRLKEFEENDKLLEAQRLRMRTSYDLEMMGELGYCNGIENYSMHIDGRSYGEPPFTLLDYFPDDYPARHRREPRRRAAAARPVRRRPQPQGHARRPRVPPPVGTRQPAAHVRRGARTGEPGGVPVGHAVGLRAAGVVERRRTDRAPDRPDRSRGHRQAHQGPDRRPDGAGQGSHRQRRARAGDHAHQEDGRGPHRLPARTGPARAVPAQQHRHDPTHRDPARPAPRRLRRAGRHQPAPRGSRPAGGVAGVHPRRRQGGLPALGDVADPDDRPGRPQRRPARW